MSYMANDPFGYRPHTKERRRLDLVRSWGVAAGAYLIGTFITARLAYHGGRLAQFDGWAGRIIWLYVPFLLLYVVIAAAGALVHAEPERSQPGRHAAATLVVPLATLVAAAVLGVVGDLTVAGLVISLVVGLVGTFAGWLLADAVRSSSAAHEEHGYF